MRPVYATIFIFAMFLAMAIYAYLDSYMDGIYMAVGFFVITLIINSSALKVRKFWIDHGASVEVEITETEIIERKGGEESIVPVDVIESVLIQENQKGVKSLSLVFSSGETGELKGYKNMEQLSLAIEELVGPYKIQRKK